MDFLDKKWLRALISIGFSVVLVAVLLPIGLKFSDSNYYNGALVNVMGCAAFGVLSYVGIILYYIAIDICDSDLLIIRILRVLLIIIGSIILFGASGITVFVYCLLSANGTFKTVSPWLCSLGGLWLFNAIAVAWAFHFVADDELEGWYPFIHILSFLASYLLFVAFAYLGQYVHWVFYGIIFAILSVLGLILSIVVWIKDLSFIPAPIHRTAPDIKPEKPKSPPAITTVIIDDNENIITYSEYQNLSCERVYFIWLHLYGEPVNCFDVLIRLNGKYISLPYYGDCDNLIIYDGEFPHFVTERTEPGYEEICFEYKEYSITLNLRFY